MSPDLPSGSRRRSQILPGFMSSISEMQMQTQMHVTLPCIKTEPNDLFKYSRPLGIFLIRFAAEVESNITSATFNGIPPGFRGLSRTSCFGNTCMCKSVFLSPELVTTSTRMKSASIDAFPLKRPRGRRKNKRKMVHGVNIERFHMTSRRSYWCSKTIKRQPFWCTKPVLWELNIFLM